MKHVYFSGIGGVALGPLAEISREAGYSVSGSDISQSLTTRELEANDISIAIGPQDGENLRRIHAEHPIDYFVYNAASQAAPEYAIAKELGITRIKRDPLLNEILHDKQLKLVAISGTHGKTTSTGMAIWLMQQLGVPVSYSIGTTISFGPSGLYDAASEYFIYECDEFDKNFLNFNPAVAIIPSLDHDHFDIYPTRESYTNAFRQFASQSGQTFSWDAQDIVYSGLPDVTLLTKLGDPSSRIAGEHNRRNAWLVATALETILKKPTGELYKSLDDFPGTDRRFEKLAKGIYSDYGHHPVEIAATLQLAHELSQNVVLLYQPHQNSRQHEIIGEYTPDVFEHAAKVLWLPTYLSREDPNLEILTPEQLTRQLPTDKLKFVDLDDTLKVEIEQHIAGGALILGMGAGTIDGWLRKNLLAAGDVIK